MNGEDLNTYILSVHSGPDWSIGLPQQAAPQRFFSSCTLVGTTSCSGVQPHAGGYWRSLGGGTQLRDLIKLGLNRKRLTV